jgi:hypothetical protein
MARTAQRKGYVVQTMASGIRVLVGENGKVAHVIPQPTIRPGTQNWRVNFYADGELTSTLTTPYRSYADGNARHHVTH